MINNMKRIIDDVNKTWERRYRFSFILTVFVYLGTLAGVGWTALEIVGGLMTDNQHIRADVRSMQTQMQRKGSEMVYELATEIKKLEAVSIVKPQPTKPEWRVTPCWYPPCPLVYR